LRDLRLLDNRQPPEKIRYFQRESSLPFLKCPRLLYQSQCEFSVRLIGPLFLFHFES